MKSWIKHFLLFFWSVVRRDDRPKIFFYHDIGQKYTGMGTPEEAFWAHMKILSESKYGYLHRVCFDDGYRGLWDAREGLGQLVKAGLRIDVFIAIALVGQPQFLTWDEIRILQNEYGLRIGGHTWSHQTLIGDQLWDRAKRETDATGRITSAWYHHELVNSKNELEKQLNLHTLTPSNLHTLTPSNPQTSTPSTPRHTVTSLCFPVGYFSDEVIQRCMAAGYTELYASFPGNIDDANSTVHLPPTPTRIIPRCLCQFVTPTEFKWILSGGMLPMAKRYFALHYKRTDASMI